jgi:hypothetical protein
MGSVHWLRRKLGRLSHLAPPWQARAPNRHAGRLEAGLRRGTLSGKRLEARPRCRPQSPCRRRAQGGCCLRRVAAGPRQEPQGGPGCCGRSREDLSGSCQAPACKQGHGSSPLSSSSKRICTRRNVACIAVPVPILAFCLGPVLPLLPVLTVATFLMQVSIS